MSNGAAAPGLFGKLASHGDFVKRRLPPDFVAAWDTWLQQGMHAGRARHGAAWPGRYLHAPLWRFVLAPGVCGQAAMAGVLVPSLDRVGRHFPLTLAAPHDHVASCLLDLATTGMDWFDRLADLAVCAMWGDLALEDLEPALVRLGEPPRQTPGAKSAFPEARACRAVFWTEGEPGVEPLLMLQHALPDASALGAMLAPACD
ncbi:type VI secretion system-associated protein TagF [Massilia oculi]|uniref:type VI secretion system-associated protein TagF n=1 Tax=Massilia oculi TaxID=945844 RepID=UPI0028A5DC9E|nr:type VI secretion system-associated protein TagF [Massilia oculi]